MSKVEKIIIHFNNLSDEAQIKLFMTLGRFAEKELATENDLYVEPVTKKEGDVK